MRAWILLFVAAAPLQFNGGYYDVERTHGGISRGGQHLGMGEETRWNEPVATDQLSLKPGPT